jgi:putative hemolysin
MRDQLFRGCFFMVFMGCFTGAVDGAVVNGCFTGGCHQELTRVKYMHGPIAAEMSGGNGCIMCHVPSGAECSESRAGSYKIKTDGLCIACHDKGTSSLHSDKEVEAKCLMCHDPHGSEVSRYMLLVGGK